MEAAIKHGKLNKLVAFYLWPLYADCFCDETDGSLLAINSSSKVTVSLQNLIRPTLQGLVNLKSSSVVVCCCIIRVGSSLTRVNTSSFPRLLQVLLIV